MDNKEFQKILLKSAFLAMAADGQIHEDEISEINKLSKSQNYFSEINFKKETQELINKINSNYKSEYIHYFEFFENNYLSTVEILLVFEVLFKIIHADLIVTDEEKNFVRFMRKKFAYVPDEIFHARFGNNELFELDNNISSFESKKVNLNQFNLDDYLGDDLVQ